MGYSLWHHSLLIRIITEGKNNALSLIFFTDWIEERQGNISLYSAARNDRR